MAEKIPISWLGDKEVVKMTNLGRSTIYSMMARGDFPKKIQLGERRSAWLEHDVRNWVMTRIKESRKAS
jgi:prophage regulatory protein